MSESEHNTFGYYFIILVNFGSSLLLLFYSDYKEDRIFLFMFTIDFFFCELNCLVSYIY